MGIMHTILENPWLLLPLLPVTILLRFFRKKRSAKRQAKRITERHVQRVGDKSIDIRPDNTIFAWDLHGVVITFSWKMAIARIFRYPIHRLVHLCIVSLNPVLLNNLVGLLKKTEVFERVMLELGENHPTFASHLPFGFDIANSQIPIPGTIKLMEKLSSQGYKHIVCSNIGSKAYGLYEQKNKELFDRLFSGVKVCTADDGYTAKPCDKYFEDFVSLFKSKGIQNIVFVDDKIKNVVGSDRNNWIGLYFTSPERLDSQLKSLGIRY